MSLVLLLMQTAPESGMDSATIIRVVAGIVALGLVVFILARRKRKASKDDWS